MSVKMTRNKPAAGAQDTRRGRSHRERTALPEVEEAAASGVGPEGSDRGTSVRESRGAAERPAARPPGGPDGPDGSGGRDPADEAAGAHRSTGAATVSAILEEHSRNILEVRGLVKVYAGRTVVDSVSFTVRRGEIIGLLGKNGAGKTTTFRMTIGMIAPDEGEIRFAGRDVTRLPMYKRARLGMGYLSQESSVFRGLTVEQNLNAILETTSMSASERVRRRDELVEEFGLGKLLHSKAAVLSGGEKRRLEIARALITSPQLILLDEPFSGVDPIAVTEIQKIVFRLQERGISILLTDHNVRETLNTTNRSFIILEGRIIAHGNRDQILNDPNARKHYLGEQFKM